MLDKDYLENTPDKDGYFGDYGGAFLPPELIDHFKQISDLYEEVSSSDSFQEELAGIRKHYQGRPTPIYHAKNLSAKAGGAQIFLKREDLNHTGAHKLNHCMGEALLAKHLGKKKLIAETGAGQHGVAMATAAAYFDVECEIHMGEVDIVKEKPNVTRMKILGCKVVPVSHGLKTLKEAVDSAFEAYLADPDNSIYCIGSVVGPHPFPKMVRDFQRIVGLEARQQMMEMIGKVPEHVVACVGGGSNAIGIFSAFLADDVQLHGVEPLGKGTKLGEHAASLSYGASGVLHGFKSLMLQTEDGQPAPVYSVASGLDYPSVGPEHAHLFSLGRTVVGTATDTEAIDSFFELSRLEGIIPALESSHATAYAAKIAKDHPGQNILVNLSGRGDKDIDFVVDNFGYPE